MTASWELSKDKWNFLCLSTALCAHGTWTRRRSTSLCSNHAPSRGRRSYPHAAPTAVMGSSLQQAAKMVPSRSGTETSVWVLKHTHIPTTTMSNNVVVNMGCLFCYGLGYRVMRLRSSGHRPERSKFTMSLTLTRIQMPGFKMHLL